MGDINLDGIPDAYVNKYGFGLVDLAAVLISAALIAGAVLIP